VSNSNNSHTADNPSIETYLDREAADDFVPVSVTQSMVITTKTT
jgi:hypothetical protein